jgi:hypothetical protein
MRNYKQYQFVIWFFGGRNPDPDRAKSNLTLSTFFGGRSLGGSGGGGGGSETYGSGATASGDQVLASCLVQAAQGIIIVTYTP